MSRSVGLTFFFADLLSFLRNKFKFLQLATHQNSVITVAFANCVFFLFSDYRGYKDRKDVSKIKSMAAKMETKTIYFLQQVRILVKKSVWKHFLLQEGLTDLANKCLFLFIHSMGNSVYSQCTLLLRDVLFYNFEMVQFSFHHSVLANMTLFPLFLSGRGLVRRVA